MIFFLKNKQIIVRNWGWTTAEKNVLQQKYWNEIVKDVKVVKI